MKTRCPCCGATLSLDALINHDAGRAALACAFKLGGDLGAALVRYLALFRPAERDLTFERVAKLLDPLLPDIENGSIVRRGQTWLAPRAAWTWAINQMCETHTAGRLTLPLKSHGYHCCMK
ncbi:MAG: hypothetical protein LBU45_09215 [Azoarcus sp.]|jgi:hypothetical protein|nr:hypothetical protein [Azoarcus sp.]